MSCPVTETQIIISDDGIKPFYQVSFSGPILNSSNYKIYVVKYAGDYQYTGKTKQTIGDKFRQGFAAFLNALEGKKVSGYGGYKWIEMYINTNEILQLYVFDLGDSCTDNNAEAIEAEIVFKIRTKYNRWPECQNEIHFFNDFENATDLADEILNRTE